MQDWKENPTIPSTHFSSALNPQLLGATYRQMLSIIVREAAERNILVLLACHRLRRSYKKPGSPAEWPASWDGYWFDDAAGLPMSKVQGPGITESCAQQVGQLPQLSSSIV